MAKRTQTRDKENSVKKEGRVKMAELTANKQTDTNSDNDVLTCRCCTASLQSYP